MTAVDPVLAAQAEAVDEIVRRESMLIGTGTGSLRGDVPELIAYLRRSGRSGHGNPVTNIRYLDAALVIENLTAQIAMRDADDAQRSEEGRTDWDYEQRISGALSERATQEEAVAEFVAFCQTTPYSVTQVAERVVDFMRAGITGSTLAAVLAPASYRPKDKQ